eukprot:Nk52_evm10s710 gene=Nk52_evmTU10s710
MQNQVTIYCGKLDPSTDELSLTDTFTRFGRIISCKIIRDNSNNGSSVSASSSSSLYGFVEFEDTMMASAAIASMNGQIMGGREIKVNWAQQQKNTNGGGSSSITPPPFLSHSAQNSRTVYGPSATSSPMLYRTSPQTTTTSAESHHGDNCSLLNSAPASANNSNGNAHHMAPTRHQNYAHQQQQQQPYQQQYPAYAYNAPTTVMKGYTRSTHHGHPSQQTVHHYQNSYRHQDTSGNNGGLTIFVGGIGHDVTDFMLFSAFSKYTSMIEARVMMDVASGKPRGYGFVKFADRKEAEVALRDMNGEVLNGRQIRTNWAVRKNGMQTTNPQQGSVSPPNGQDMDSSRSYNNNSGMPKHSNTAVGGGALHFNELHSSKLPSSSNTTVYVSFSFIDTGVSVSKNMDEVEDRQSDELANGSDGYFASSQSGQNMCKARYELDEHKPVLTEEFLRREFSSFGNILEVKSYISKGFAFVMFDSHDNAANAIAMKNGKTINCSTLPQSSANSSSPCIKFFFKCSWGRDPVNVYSNQTSCPSSPASVMTTAGAAIANSTSSIYSSGGSSSSTNSTLPASSYSSPSMMGGYISGGRTSHSSVIHNSPSPFHEYTKKANSGNNIRGDSTINSNITPSTASPSTMIVGQGNPILRGTSSSRDSSHNDEQPINNSMILPPFSQTFTSSHDDHASNGNFMQWAQPSTEFVGCFNRAKSSSLSSMTVDDNDRGDKSNTKELLNSGGESLFGSGRFSCFSDLNPGNISFQFLEDNPSTDQILPGTNDAVDELFS